jgi:hypothetical protein
MIQNPVHAGDSLHQLRDYRIRDIIKKSGGRCHRNQQTEEKSRKSSKIGQGRFKTA